ncbi:hypothetical protein D3C85_881600 [compost metagenome]
MGQVLGNAGGLLGQLLGVVGQRSMAAAVILLGRLARLLQIVEMGEQGAAKLGVFLDITGDLVCRLQALVFTEGVAIKALEVVDGILLRTLDW